MVGDCHETRYQVRECLAAHMNSKFFIRHVVFVEKIVVVRLCVANVHECFDYSLSVPPSAGLVADVRPSLSAETGGIVPTIVHCVDGAFWPGDTCRLTACFFMTSINVE